MSIKKQADWKATCAGLFDRSHEKNLLKHPATDAFLLPIKIDAGKRKPQFKIPGRDYFAPEP